MGNYKFRLSDMLPNAWFYKLKDMGSSRTRKHRNTNTTPPPPQFMRKNSINSNFSSSSSSASKKKPHLHIGLDLAYPYSFTPDYNTLDKLYASPINQKASDTHFPDDIHLQQARISSKSKRRPKRKTVYRPSPTLVSSSNRNRPASPILFPDDLLFSSINSSPDITSIRNAAAAASPPPPPPPNDHHSFNEPSSCNCRISSSTADIIIDVNDDDEEEDDASITRKDENLVGFDIISEIGLLPPILTKPVKTATTKPNYPLAKKKSSARSTTGVKLSRSNSPKISSRRINSNNNSNQGQARKSVKSKNRRSKVFSESFAIVKSSVDPQRDFRESMVEMIVENNIRASKDLEDLLACYLTLNSDQYHDLIVKAFEQIWFDMADLAI